MAFAGFNTQLHADDGSGTSAMRKVPEIEKAFPAVGPSPIASCPPARNSKNAGTIIIAHVCFIPSPSPLRYNEAPLSYEPPA